MLRVVRLTNIRTDTMMRKISEFTLEKNIPDLLIDKSIESFGTSDFYKAKEIIKEGEMATIDALANTTIFE